MERKFHCYFCNETITNETDVGHTAVCSRVLIPCPNKCGVFILRKDILKHRNDCVNCKNSQKPKQSLFQSNSHNYEYNTMGKGSNVAENSLKKSISNSSLPNSGSTLTNRNSPDIGFAINSQNKIFQSWKKIIEKDCHELKLMLNHNNARLDNNEIEIAHIKKTMKVLESEQIEMKTVLDGLIRDNSLNRSLHNDLHAKIEFYQSNLKEDSQITTNSIMDQKKRLKMIKDDLDGLKKKLDEQKAKHSSVVFDCRAVSQIAGEAVEKVEIQEKQLDQFRNELTQMKLDLEILEGLTASSEYIKPGKLIWKVKDISTQLELSKGINAILKSPVFYTHECGYKIRVFIYLNGLKKWKDRYALISIHVLKGDYDLLLKWPCNIEGTVTIRDLDNVENPKNFTKFITAKREKGDEENEDPQESSSSYIFVPHNVLFTDKYIKEDTTFFEIKINNKNHYETNL